MGRTVLIVEDEPELASLLIDILESEGDRGVTSPAGQAVEVALRERPDLVVVDYTMPGLTGTDVAERIREALENDAPPIILVTGHQHVAELAEEARVQGFLRKPFDVDEFLDLVRSTARVRDE